MQTGKLPFNVGCAREIAKTVLCNLKVFLSALREGVTLHWLRTHHKRLTKMIKPNASLSDVGSESIHLPMTSTSPYYLLGVSRKTLLPSLTPHSPARRVSVSCPSDGDCVTFGVCSQNISTESTKNSNGKTN